MWASYLLLLLGIWTREEDALLLALIDIELLPWQELPSSLCQPTPPWPIRFVSSTRDEEKLEGSFNMATIGNIFRRHVATE